MVRCGGGGKGEDVGVGYILFFVSLSMIFFSGLLSCVIGKGGKSEKEG